MLAFRRWNPGKPGLVSYLGRLGTAALERAGWRAGLLLGWLAGSSAERIRIEIGKGGRIGRVVTRPTGQSRRVMRIFPF